MSVLVEEGVVRLQGRCLAEDAEALLVALQEGPDRTVDLTGVTRLHLAVIQVLLAARPSVQGVPEQSFAARNLVNLLQ